MSERVGLLRLLRAGLTALPAPSNGNGNTRALQVDARALPEPPALPLSDTVAERGGLPNIPMVP